MLKAHKTMYGHTYIAEVSVLHGQILKLATLRRSPCKTYYGCHVHGSSLIALHGRCRIEIILAHYLTGLMELVGE
jgi:hypothetical protein